MNSPIYIDFGSSTTKIYTSQEDGILSLNRTSSIPIRANIGGTKTLSDDTVSKICNIIHQVKNDFPGSKIKNIATAHLRSADNKRNVVNNVFTSTGISLNIISHELENFFLQKSLTDKVNLNTEILLVNIGGGSTELVLMKNGEVISTNNFNLGVKHLLEKYPTLNEGVYLGGRDDILDFILDELGDVGYSVETAIYGGGELDYMIRAGYDLEKNEIFQDLYHPNILSFDSFERGNRRVFSEYHIDQLKNMMPNDPNWMLGARACSAIAEGIFMRLGVKLIIPSNSNTIHGFQKQEFRNVTISGSFRKHIQHILAIKDHVQKNGVSVLSPRFELPKNPGEEFIVFHGEEGLSPLELEQIHLDAIANSDALIVVSPDGYVGNSAIMEVGYALAQGKRIIFTEEPNEFMLQQIPHEVDNSLVTNS